MKRAFLLFAISVFLLRLPVKAQDTASNAAAIAAKEDADERYKRLAADLQAVQSDNEALHAKIAAMEDEIQTLRAAQAKPGDNSGVQDDLKRLAEKIQEVDNKRLEDKEAIAEQIRKSIGGIEKSLGGTSAPSRTSGAKPAVVSDTPASDKGFSYTIQEGDRLEAVVRAYNADFKTKGMKTITLKQAMEANPSVDWTRLRVGQKIIIPRPDGG